MVLRLVCYFYYLCVLDLVVMEFPDQQEDLECDISEQSIFILIDGVFIPNLGRTRTSSIQ